jgi:hypothetical protein
LRPLFTVQAPNSHPPESPHVRSLIHTCLAPGPRARPLRAPTVHKYYLPCPVWRQQRNIRYLSGPFPSPDPNNDEAGSLLPSVSEVQLRSILLKGTLSCLPCPNACPDSRCSSWTQVADDDMRVRASKASGRRLVCALALISASEFARPARSAAAKGPRLPQASAAVRGCPSAIQA